MGDVLRTILEAGDIDYVMHIGVKRVLTFRDWVPNQNFQTTRGSRSSRAGTCACAICGRT